MSVRPLAQMGAFLMGEEKEEPPLPPPPLGRGWRKAKQAIRVAQAVRPTRLREIVAALRDTRRAEVIRVHERAKGRGVQRRSWEVPMIAGGILVVVAGCVGAVIIASYNLNPLVPEWDDGEHPVFPLIWISATDPDRLQVATLLELMLVVNSTVLVLSMNVAAIVIQIASTRFSSQVSTIFFQSYFLMFCLFLFLFNNLNVLVIGAFTSELYVPRLEILVAEVLSFGGAVMMYPFFICTFRITSAEQIICKLGAMALSATDPARNSTLALVAANKPKICHAVESLANIGLNMQQGDKIHSYQIGHELCELVLSYGALHKHMLPDSWHIIDVSACESPDFFNLDYESLQTLETNQAWLEWKVLRQYQMLFANALTRKSPGFASLIAANTRKICEAAAVQGRGAIVDLGMKFFNTYMRYAITGKDGDLCSGVLQQYRKVGEFLLHHSTTAHNHEQDKVGDRPLMVLRYLAYYSELALKRDLAPIAELIAHDMSQLCQQAYILESPLHASFQQTFLMIDHVAIALQIETAVLGIRKAQIALAVTYLINNDQELAMQVYRNMAADPPERVAIVRTQLTKLNDREFWEVGERSSNAEFLTPPQQRQLNVFFRMWEEGSVTASPTQQKKNEEEEEEAAKDGLRFTPPGLLRHEDADDSAWSEEHGAEDDDDTLPAMRQRSRTPLRHTTSALRHRSSYENRMVIDRRASTFFPTRNLPEEDNRTAVLQRMTTR